MQQTSEQSDCKFTLPSKKAFYALCDALQHLKRDFYQMNFLLRGSPRRFVYRGQGVRKWSESPKMTVTQDWLLEAGIRAGVFKCSLIRFRRNWWNSSGDVSLSALLSVESGKGVDVAMVAILEDYTLYVGANFGSVTYVTSAITGSVT
jgi:hypothetical protein